MSVAEPPDRPTRDLLARQSARLAGLRATALRRADIARRRMVLDLGAGPGVVTAELTRRAGGPVIALDRSRDALREIAGARRVAARAEALPFPDGAFELVFAQLVFLWLRDAERAVCECARVLAPGGVLVALEPDFGGLIEHPPALALGDLWRAAIARAGGDPLAGRHLIALLGRAGFTVDVALSPALVAEGDDRFTLLGGLSLLADERARLDAARRANAATPPAERVVHLPIFCVLATRR